MVSPLEDVELSGSRGTANFAMKWAKDSRHEASLSVQQIKGMTRSFTADDAGSFVPVVAFECRGLEPIDWQPGVRLDIGGVRFGFDPFISFLLPSVLPKKIAVEWHCLWSSNPDVLSRLQENFIVKGLGKTVWEDVDLSSLEWADYDEDTQESVSIMELEWKFEVYRPKK